MFFAEMNNKDILIYVRYFFSIHIIDSERKSGISNLTIDGNNQPITSTILN